MITLLGVGHVFDIGGAVRREIVSRRPRVVALELDAMRYAALLARTPRSAGLSVFQLVALLESRIARKYGVQVGEEMVAAARAAQEVGSELALIDMDSRQVLLRTWSQMPFGERLKFLGGVLGSLFVSKRQVESELRRYEQDNEAVLTEFAANLPTAKRVLIDERDEHMARALVELNRTKGEVVAVVGDGHVAGLLRRIANEPVQVVRLRDLRSAGPTTNASVSFGYQL